MRLYFAQRGESRSDSDCRSTWNDRVTHLFKEIDPSDGFSEEELRTRKSLLSPGEAKRCFDVLRNMRTLDPAVGSGAFPVGLLHELISLQRIFETVAHSYDDPVKGSGTRWMQDFVNRIKTLATRFSDRVTPLVGDITPFANQVRDSRHYYTHHDPSIKQKGLVASRTQFTMLNYHLTLLFRLCVLSEFKLDADPYRALERRLPREVIEY